MSTPLRLLDLATLRRLEGGAIRSTGEGVLMERAGQAAWRCLLQHWPQAQRICVVCGPGNNGGDGYVLARLALESGCAVHVVALEGQLPAAGDGARAGRRFVESRGQIEVFEGALPDADIVVDALFGIGLSRAPEAAAQALIEAMNHQPAPVLALDVPSGVNADSGDVPGAAVKAARTLQFIAPHRGLYTGAACDHVGALDLASLDVTLDPNAAGTECAFAVDAQVAIANWPPRPRNAHKGLFGHVLCVGGNIGMGGAIALCADAALRMGAGLVSVATRPAHVGVVLARRPEAMVHGIEAADALEPLLQAADAIAIGPGLGQDAWAKDLLACVLASGKPLVVDADALNLLAQDGQDLPAGCVITPHPGEAARLLQSTTSAIQRNRFAAATQLAQHFNAAVVLKGCGTLVAANGAPTRVVLDGNPGMASAGMGDALTGFVATLLAQCESAADAAWKAAALHAACGDYAASTLGERSLLASDLIAALPAVLRGEGR